MIKYTILIFLLLTSVSALSQIKVELVNGDVTFNDSMVEKSTVLTTNGTLSVGRSGVVKVSFLKHNTYLILSSFSNVEINQNPKKIPFKFLNGAVRLFPIDKKKKINTKLKTPNSIIYAKAKDLLVFVKPALTESEVYCIEGSVKIYSSKDDFVSISNSQWAGVGGRYGKTVSKLEKLPSSFLNNVKSFIPIQ